MTTKAIRKSVEKLLSNTIQYNKKNASLQINKEVLDAGIIKVFHVDLKKEPGSNDLAYIQERAEKAAHKIEHEVIENKNALKSYINNQGQAIKSLYEKIEQQSYKSCDVEHMQKKASKALNDLLQPSSGGYLNLIFDITKAYGIGSKISSLNNSVSSLVREVCGPKKATLDTVAFELSSCRTSFTEIFSSLKGDINIKGNRDNETQKDAVKHLIKFYKAFEDVFYNLKNIAITNEINKDDLLLESSLKHIIKNLDLKTESPDAIMAQGKAISELGLALNTNSARLKAIESKNILPALNLDSSDLFSGVYTYDYGHMLWSRQDNCAQDAIKLLGSTAVICKDIKAYSNTITKYIEDPSSMTDLSSPTGFWNGVAGGFRWTLEIFGEGFSEFFMGEASSGRQLDRLTKQVEKIAAHSPDFVVSIQPIKLEASEARYGVNGDYSIIDNEADEHLDMGYNYPTMAETN